MTTFCFQLGPLPIYFPAHMIRLLLYLAINRASKPVPHPFAVRVSFISLRGPWFFTSLSCFVHLFILFIHPVILFVHTLILFVHPIIRFVHPIIRFVHPIIRFVHSFSLFVHIFILVFHPLFLFVHPVILFVHREKILQLQEFYPSKHITKP